MDSKSEHRENLKVYHILIVKKLSHVSNVIVAKCKTFVVKHVSKLLPINVYQCFTMF